MYRFEPSEDVVLTAYGKNHLRWSIDYGGTYKVKNETRTTVTPLNAQGTNREGHCQGGQRELRARRTRRNVGEVKPNIGHFLLVTTEPGLRRAKERKRRKRSTTRSRLAQAAQYQDDELRRGTTRYAHAQSHKHNTGGNGNGNGERKCELHTYRTRAVNIDVFQELKSARNRAEESEGEEKEKEKEYNQEHTRSNAQYQDHELRRGTTRYAHAQAHSTDCKLWQNITPEGENGNGERNANYTRTTQGL
ncbi:hypothetical protein BJY52DRAFT_1229221 [Lactarius psammicola]|nr:hypothetical protein BJY52DRAFT_1229221 [Lactarius psammicola]